MRKLVLMIITVLFVLSFTGCDTEKDNALIPDWGVELTATKITPTGLILVCKQAGGNPKGDLETSDFYTLEVQENNEWAAID